MIERPATVASECKGPICQTHERARLSVAHRLRGYAHPSTLRVSLVRALSMITFGPTYPDNLRGG